MDKITSELTFILPLRIDSDYRLKNLISILKFYSYIRDFNFLILEADISQKIDLSALEIISDKIRYIFIKDGRRVFHRTRFINLMLREVKTRFAAVWDADAICPHVNIIEACKALIETDKTMAYPFDGKFWQINEFFSNIFHRSQDILVLSEYKQPRLLMDGYYSVGGAFIVDVKKYRSYGWENEYFEGWGPEDKERFKRLEILGEKPLRIPGDLYHLYHPRGINSGMYDKELAFSTKKEYCKVCSMSTIELRKYVNSWKWIEV